MCLTSEFCHLHVHSDASRIDGLGSVNRLVSAASRLGYKKLGLTDHGSLANTLAFIASCGDNGIKPIIGMEGYIEVDGKVGHITLLADGNAGFRSLVNLNNLGQKSSNRRPAFKLDHLISNNAGIICLTGCPASPLHDDDYATARDIGKRLKEAFGARLFAETMFVSEFPTWERSQKLAKDLKIASVVTNDAHFPWPEDAQIHTVLTQLKADFTYESRLLFLATPQQILQRLNDRRIPEAIPFAQAGLRNAAILSDKIKPVTFSGVPTLPHIEDAEVKLRRLVNGGITLKTVKPDGTIDEEKAKAFRERADYELGIIHEMDFDAYFLILYDMVSSARDMGVRVGPGRGSGAGSLVLYLIGVTEVNPLDWDLSFERFLNPKRKGMPDVDIDFDSEGRHDVIKRAMEKWGAYPVATYARYSHKMLVHDLAKHFRLPKETEKVAADEGPDSEAFKELGRRERLFQPTYDAMMEQIRHIGKHAGGIIITDAPVPLERASGGTGELVAAWTEGDKKELTKAGVVKFDILGLSALSVLKQLEEQLGVKPPEFLPPGSPEFELFRTGDTVGIFQFTGSDGIVRFTMEVAPDSIEDLVAINALYRPGALDAGTAKQYPKWRKNPRKVHPLIDEILAPTYGVIVYQEQVMAVYAAFTDGDLGSADEARRTISKSKFGDPDWEVDLADLEAKMVDGAISKGVPEKVVRMVWNEIKTHARYSFNKSHSVAYALIAMWMAWYKFHYRAHFTAAMLDNDPAEAQKYIFDAVRHGIEIVMPHVNVSTDHHVVKDGKIYMPFSIIKYLGESGVKAIIENQPFKSLADFMDRVPKRDVKARARQGLFALGSYEGLPKDGKEGHDELKVLGITKPEDGTMFEKQQMYLGFIIPSKKLLAAIAKAEDEGFVAGMIVDAVEKESKFGKYTTYYLMPNRAVWSRDRRDLKVGSIVKLKIKKDSGKILSVQSL